MVARTRPLPLSFRNLRWLSPSQISDRRLQICWALLILSACGGGSASTQPSPVPTSTTAPPAAAPAPSASAPPTSVVRLADDFGGRTRALHPDFGPPPYGIPYVGVGGAEPRSPIAFVEYGGESDRGFGSEIGYPIPDAAKTQANVIEGGVPGGGSDGDRHLIVVDRDRWILYGPDRRRQRQRYVCDRRHGCALEQRRAQSGIQEPDGRRFRDCATGMAVAPSETIRVELSGKGGMLKASTLS